MAMKVGYADLKNPCILAVRYVNIPFGREEIKLLTAKVPTFALVKDDGQLYIYAEGEKKRDPQN